MLSQIWKWFKQLISGKPHMVSSRDGSTVYLNRWYLVPRNRYLNVYLHQFLKDAEDRALHDHPWWFASVMLWGGYREITPGRPFGVRRSLLSVAFRMARHIHRVVLLRDRQGNPLPCWTIVLTGPTVRTWGFWCPKGFVPWQQFVDSRDAGKTGAGCGDS